MSAPETPHAAAIAAVMAAGVSLDELIHAYSTQQNADEPALQVFVDGFAWNDETELAGSGFVSDSDDGAFVLAWVWVRNDEAGIEEADEESEDDFGTMNAADLLDCANGHHNVDEAAGRCTVCGVDQ